MHRVSQGKIIDFTAPALAVIIFSIRLFGDSFFKAGLQSDSPALEKTKTICSDKVKEPHYTHVSLP